MSIDEKSPYLEPSAVSSPNLGRHCTRCLRCLSSSGLAQSGIEKWTVDRGRTTMTFSDKTGQRDAGRADQLSSVSHHDLTSLSWSWLWEIPIQNLSVELSECEHRHHLWGCYFLGSNPRPTRNTWPSGWRRCISRTFHGISVGGNVTSNPTATQCLCISSTSSTQTDIQTPLSPSSSPSR